MTASIASPVLSTSFSLTNNPGAPATIVATNGSGQSVAINTQRFANPLLVTTGNRQPRQSHQRSERNLHGARAEPGQRNLRNQCGDCQCKRAPRRPASDPTPVASATAYNVTAAITGTPAVSTTFTLTNTAGPAANIAITGGNNQSAGILTPYANPLSVTVTDAGNNPVANAVVTFTTPLQTVMRAGRSPTESPRRPPTHPA